MVSNCIDRRKCCILGASRAMSPSVLMPISDICRLIDSPIRSDARGA